MDGLRFSDPAARAQYYRTSVQTLATWITDDGSVGPEDLGIKQRRRLTHQYISALIRAGFPRDTRELRLALDWLIQSADTDVGSSGAEYYVVPDKIEAAIEMGERDGDFCYTAVELLLKRRNASSLSYSVPGEAPNAFHSLWAAKIFANFPDRVDCVTAV